MSLSVQPDSPVSISSTFEVTAMQRPRAYTNTKASKKWTFETEAKLQNLRRRQPTLYIRQRSGDNFSDDDAALATPTSNFSSSMYQSLTPRPRPVCQSIAEDVELDVNTKSAYQSPPKSPEWFLGVKPPLSIPTILKRDSFLKDVGRRTLHFGIGKDEAETEALIDRLIREHGGKNEALMYVVSNMNTESKVYELVSTLLQRGAEPVVLDSMGRSALHYAVTKRFRTVTMRLLAVGASTTMRDAKGHLPYKLALDNKSDDIAALLLVYTPNEVVREWYTAEKRSLRGSEYSFKELIKTNMVETILSLLDCMIDREAPKCKVYYHILESDKDGRAPNDPAFNLRSTSPLDMIARMGNTRIIEHEIVRLHIHRKWVKFARFRFIWSAIFYLISLIALTVSMAIASEEPIGSNSMSYYSDTTPLHILRIVCEVVALMFVLSHIIIEVMRMCHLRLKYWKDLSNWFDLVAVACLIIVIPLRIVNADAHWLFFAFGYFMWALRMFRYAAVFHTMGSFVHTLKTIICADFVQFAIVYGIILLAFSGALVLTHRWESESKINGTNIDIQRESHNEQECHGISNVLLCGLRSLVEDEAIVGRDEHFGPAATFIAMTFTLTSLVVLVNILIAKLSDTYTKSHATAQRRLEMNRARIITRLERFALFTKYRIKYYTPMEEVIDPSEEMEEYATTDICPKWAMEMKDQIDFLGLQVKELRQRLAQQDFSLGNLSSDSEETRMEIKEQLAELIRTLRTPEGASSN